MRLVALVSVPMKKKLNLLFKVTKDGKEFELTNRKNAKELLKRTFNDLSTVGDDFKDKDSMYLVLLIRFRYYLPKKWFNQC